MTTQPTTPEPTADNPGFAIAEHNGRLVYLQEDGRPAMYVDDVQELC